MAYNDQGFDKAPVDVGEEFDVRIESVGEKGDGLARVRGFVLFVPGVKEGDEVRIRVTKVLSKVGFAEVVSSAAGTVPAPKERHHSAPEVVPEDTEDFGE